jgi:hypothetical protein
MYGKHFESTYSGSMLGAGSDVFAVWGYVIAHTRNSQVELNPQLLAVIIGAPPEAMEQAVSYLCAPDARSRSTNEDGRRLVREGQFAYRVVNHAEYAKIRNEDERREYNREAQRRHRDKASSHVKTFVNDCQQCQPTQTQTQTQQKRRATGVAPRSRIGRGDTYPEDFEVWYKTYPKHRTKKQALAEWLKLTLAEHAALPGLTQKWNAARLASQRPDGFLPDAPDPVRFLKHRRWEDEADSPPQRDHPKAPSPEDQEAFKRAREDSDLAGKRKP